MTKHQLLKIYTQANMDRLLNRAHRSAIADYEIMRARTLATMRGATPAEIQRNVALVEGSSS
jgi:hypothetical protein